jgi:hypothetical protein
VVELFLLSLCLVKHRDSFTLHFIFYPKTELRICHIWVSVCKYVSAPNSDRIVWVSVTMAWRVVGLRMDDNGLHISKVLENILNKQAWTADKGLSSSFGVGRGATTPYVKNRLVTACYTGPRYWQSVVNTMKNILVVSCEHINEPIGSLL